MKQKSRETIERAIGFVEGLSWGTDDKVSTALIALAEMLESVLTAEEGADNEQRKAD